MAYFCHVDHDLVADFIALIVDFLSEPTVKKIEFDKTAVRDEIAQRISAIISKSIQDLNNDPESALYQRIQTTDGQKDFLCSRNIPYRLCQF